MADSITTRPGAGPRPNLVKCEALLEGLPSSARPTLRPGEAIWRIALGVEEPLSSRISRLINAELDMTCALVTDRARVLQMGLRRACPDVLVLDMAWGATALAFIENVMQAHPLPILVIDTEAWTPYMRGRLEHAWKLGIAGVIPYPNAQELRSGPTRAAFLQTLREAVRPNAADGATPLAKRTRGESLAWSTRPAHP